MLVLLAERLSLILDWLKKEAGYSKYREFVLLIFLAPLLNIPEYSIKNSL